MSPQPPECTDALLALLRSKRLLDDDALERLSSAWDGNDAPGSHIDELVAAGLLTPFQARYIRQGKVGHLRRGPYRLVEELGRAVYRAEHILLGRTVVLKILGRRSRRPLPSNSATESCEDSGMRSPNSMSRTVRSRREILAAGTLAHPHFIAAHDARWIRGRLVLVLEHVEGIDLSRLLDQIGPLPIDLVGRIAEQTASALAFLHLRGLVHRDVKPANLLLSGGIGSEALVKLLDLGLICPTGTQGEELCGTPDYMPPERGHSPDAIDIRGDLYALGCTLYELLTGRVPFPGGTWTEKLLRHRLEVPTPLTELRPDVSPALAEVISRLMAREPEDRPASPTVVLAMLAKLGNKPHPVSSAAGSRLADDLSMSAIPSLEPVRSSPALRAGKAGGMRFRPYLLAVMMGVTLGGLGKVLTPSPALPPTPASLVVSGITVATLDLESVLSSAPDGAVVELPEGEYRIGPIRVEGRSLTLRAHPGSRARLRVAGQTRRWDALLSCDRDLTLEGIDLVGDENALAPLVLVETGRLILQDCKLTQRGSSPAVSLRRGSAVEIRRCEVWALAQAVAVELGATQTALRFDESRLEVRDPSGPALLLWCPEFDPSARAELRLGDCDIQAGRVVACRCVGGAVLLESHRNKLSFQQALVSLDECGVRDDWRRVLSYAGRSNRHDAAGAWLRLEGRPVNVWSENAWAALWSDAKSATSSGEFVRTRHESSLQSSIRR